MSKERTVEVFAGEVWNPEGPVSLANGDWVVTEMASGDITRFSGDGARVERVANTGRPNGLVLDHAGNLLVAESLTPSLLRLTMDGSITTLSTGSAETPLLWPNDLCFGPDGALYMTDSGVLLADMEGASSPDAMHALPIDGRVLRIDASTYAVTVIDRGLRFANGIAIGPDDEYLYAAETLTGNIYRYALHPAGSFGSRELFTNVMVKPGSDYSAIAGPDGMAFDETGRLYVCVLEQADVTVVGSDGGIVERIPLPGSFPTNIAFDVSGKRTAIVTEGSGSQLLTFQTDAAGLPLHK